MFKFISKIIEWKTILLKKIVLAIDVKSLEQFGQAITEGNKFGYGHILMFSPKTIRSFHTLASHSLQVT